MMRAQRLRIGAIDGFLGGLEKATHHRPSLAAADSRAAGTTPRASCDV